MTRKFLVVLFVVLILPGCMTAPPGGALIGASTPKIVGPESGYSGAGMAGAHEWLDNDARTALWLRRNLPERWAEVPFPLVEFFRYNIHNDRQQFSPFEWEYYFANMRDPYLQVRMFTLESRDRNRVKREEVITKEAAAKAAEEKAVAEDVSLMSDEDVQKNLQIVYP